MRAVVGLTMAAIVALTASYAFSPRPTPPLAATVLPIKLMQLDSIVRSSAGLVAGGELGKIVISSDQGKNWQVAKVSADRQALITQIVFDKDGKTGMAVGHEGWILRTSDGGLSWQEVAFDSKDDEPLMSVAHLPSGAWIAVGAFGRAARSDDGGTTWVKLDLSQAGVEDKHMNRIVGSLDGQQWMIVGERGLVLLSDAQGRQWTPVKPFYNGSFYNAMPLGSGDWLVYGMRGNVFRSTDGGATWTKSEVPAPASFFSGARMANGRLLLVGQGGIVASSADGGEHFSIARVGKRATLTDILLQPDGSGWTTSDAGLQTYTSAVSAAPAAAAAGATSTAPHARDGVAISQSNSGATR